MVAAIEAGGTKIVVGAGRSWQEVRDGEKLVVPTGRPEEGLAAIAEWIGATTGRAVAAVGVASFGPLDLARGVIGATPKPGWAGLDWFKALAHHFPEAAVGVDTDTNGAALAEWRWGAGSDRDVTVYLTVGTGIGAGIVVAGRVMHGLIHPELGHMRVPRQPEDSFEGVCPFHGDCLEGLASGPAVAARWGVPGDRLPPGHPAWALEARYLAAALADLTFMMSPQILIVGGGVAAAPGLLDSVRAGVRALIGGYLDSPLLSERIDEYIVTPGLGSDSGVLGAFALGREALDRRMAERPGG